MGGSFIGLGAAFNFGGSYLDLQDRLSAERVCKTLRSAILNDPLLWRCIHIHYELGDKLTDDGLLRLTQKAQGNLQCLSVVGCLKITDDGLRRVLENCPNLSKARIGKFLENWVKFVRSISGWTATLLFMWMPIAQMWTTYLNPDNIKGLSALTILLGMIGNALMIPRALFIRDLMWFTGVSWASVLHGWGNLACMYLVSTV